MAGILEDLANAYSVPLSYLKSGLTPRTSQGTGADMTNALSMPSGDSMYMPPTVQAAQAQGVQAMPAPAPVGLLGPGGFGGSGGQDATAAPVAAPVAAPIAPPSPADAGGGGVANLPANLPTATGPADVTVGDGTTDTSGAGGTTDQTAQAGGGLLTNIINQGMAASQDPDPSASQSFLGKLSDGFKEIGNKLTNLSPAASQGLISAGMTMLAANSGGRNLSQIVGEGGIAGVNQYQTIVQNKIAAELKQQELAQNLWEKQQQIITERAKGTAVKPGEAIYTPGGGLQYPGGGGNVPTNYATVTNPDGTQDRVGYNYMNQEVNRQPLNQGISQPTQDNINKSVQQAQASQLQVHQLDRFQNQLQEQVPDPAHPGQMMQNPNYIGVPGGLIAKGVNAWTALTGNAPDSTVLRQQIQQTLNASGLSSMHTSIGGRLSNNDITLLRSGMPDQNASGEYLAKWMGAYQNLLADRATRDQVSSQYMQLNRGDMRPLWHDTTIGGKTYSQGTSYQSILDGTAKPVAEGDSPSEPGRAPVALPQTPAAPAVGTPAVAAPTTAPTATPATAPAPAPRVAAQAVVNQAIRAARNGDKVAQAALTRQRISWS